MNNRLVLGTAQFGLSYGIANRNGQVGLDEMATILERSWASGIQTLDTAIAYGESEQQLGKVGVGRWRIISKLPAIPESFTDTDAWVARSVLASLDRLRIPKLHGLLLHRPNQLLGPQGEALYEALLLLKDQGKVEKIGVSIYSPEELDNLWPRYPFDLIQAPFNIVDRRLAASGWLKRLHQAGAEIHVRSVFLQGLLLLEAAERPPIFDRWKPLWRHWDGWLDSRSLTPLQACLGFVLAQPEIDHIVVGVDSLAQLEEILDHAKARNDMPPKVLMSEDLDLIHPSHWNVA